MTRVIIILISDMYDDLVHDDYYLTNPQRDDSLFKGWYDSTPSVYSEQREGSFPMSLEGWKAWKKAKPTFPKVKKKRGPKSRKHRAADARKARLDRRGGKPTQPDFVEGGKSLIDALGLLG